jgi:cobalt/nickel transport system permease protein
MHIVDGVLSASVLVSGAALAAGGIALGLQRIDIERIPQVAVLSAVFFVASLVHIPVGPSSVHLILNGLMGIALGWAAFPALFVALLLQVVFFGFGGLLVLGVNTFNLALPAVLCFYLCGPGVRNGKSRAAFIWGVLAGALAILFSVLTVGASLALSGEEFIVAAKLLFLSHVPVMVVEGLLTGAAVVLVRKVKPQLFNLPLQVPA